MVQLVYQIGVLTLIKIRYWADVPSILSSWGLALYADKDEDTITCIWKQSWQIMTKMQVPSGLFWSAPDSNAFICACTSIGFLLAVACGSWSSCSLWSCSWGFRLSRLSSCLRLLVLGLPDCHCGQVHGVQGRHCRLGHGFPACHRCVPAPCCPVLVHHSSLCYPPVWLLHPRH